MKTSLEHGSKLQKYKQTEYFCKNKKILDVNTQAYIRIVKKTLSQDIGRRLVKFL